MFPRLYYTMAYFTYRLSDTGVNPHPSNPALHEPKQTPIVKPIKVS